MLHRNSLKRWLCLVMLLPIAASAQDRAWIILETNAQDAVVYADSIRLGSADAALFTIAPGATRLRLVRPNAGTWSEPPTETTVHPTVGDTIHVILNVPYRYRIESVPFGATVYLASDSSRSEPLGETPVLLERSTPLGEALVLRRQGYHARTIEPGSALWNRHSAVLEPTQSQREAAAATEVEWHPPSRRQAAWIDYASVGLGVVGAVVAVHYKFKADRLYDQYLETGDLSLRSPIERYDRRSGAALIGMQVGITVFAIRLILK